MTVGFLGLINFSDKKMDLIYQIKEANRYETC